ncbi:MAG TPA: fibronectin type III domain-containing protein [Thermoanaerobaculia bacterium]|jgi:hypothetical protein|nr:fibronectin type III domain-containing protein [Thermoanaerobaculia bacterium]
MTGQNIVVPAGGNLQNAINAALPGDTILLAAGATYVGPFTLPVKNGSGWIVIRSSAPDSSLPPAGQRITPAYAAQLPKIVTSDTGPAVLTDAGAHHFRFTAVEFGLGSSVPFSYALIQLGDGSLLQNSLSLVPYALVLDRVYAHGRSNAELRRAVALNSGSAAVIDSYISEVHEAGADSQAIAGWNGPGPYKIVNNYLEAATENVIFGGGDPLIVNLVPSDIEVRRNHFDKQLAWRGSQWSIKNLFELKNARRVLIDGNIFEHNWQAAQAGFSILFTVRNQDGTAPWSVVEDITFTNNIVRHVSSAVNILGYDDINISQQAKRILIKNNLFDDVSSVNWDGSGILFQLLNHTADVTIDHNTGFHDGHVIATGPLNSTEDRFYYRNNLTPNNLYGVGGDGTYGNPNLTLSTYFPGAVFIRNILVGGDATNYPAGNYFPATMANVGFVDFAGANYRLAPTSPYKNLGTDGKDIGVDMDALEAATAPPIDTPSGFSATATSSSQVALSWLAVTGATGYEVHRATTISTFSLALSTTSATSAVDSSRLANTTYLYKVRAIGAGGPSAFSTVDAATTIVFTDASLPGKGIRAIHIMELRTAVNAMRIAAGLTQTTFTDASLAGTVIKRVHITELRSSLDAARSTIGLSAMGYTDPTLTAGVTMVKAAHLQELRNGTQ